MAEGSYAPLNPPEWIANLKPKALLFNVALKDTAGLPSLEALQSVEGYTLLRVGRKSCIQLSMDGEQIGSEVERKQDLQGKL